MHTANQTHVGYEVWGAEMDGTCGTQKFEENILRFTWEV